MTAIVEVPDNEGLYAAISAGSQSKALTRARIDRLGRSLAKAIRVRVPATDRVLSVVILRGGALLYPGFAAELGESDFCMLGLRRVGDAVISDYRTVVAHPTYDRVLYVDCVAATGGTILQARKAVAEVCDVGEETAAVICSAARATRTLHDAGVNVIGFSLQEAESSGVVAPDLGRLDAGDLFTGGPALTGPDSGAAAGRACPA